MKNRRSRALQQAQTLQREPGEPLRAESWELPQALEEKLSAGGRLTLLAKCAPAQAEDVLGGVDGVLTHTVSDAGAGTVRAELSCAGDRRESLFYAFAAARCPLLELRGRTASLEDVFLELEDRHV